MEVARARRPNKSPQDETRAILCVWIMPAQIRVINTVLVSLLCCALTRTAAPDLCAQSKPNPVQDQGDVVRVFNELVQTDVMVFDKQGHVVNGLKREDFLLKIDGKERPIDFFERVTAGSNEESQLAAARGTSPMPTATPRKGPVPLDRGRTVFFYVDDLHLDLNGLTATKKLLKRFLDDEMGQNDEVAITSASGQIGFLQQLTDNKRVLAAAFERIQLRPYNVRDMDRPPMSEYQAILIEDNDIDVLEYFIDETLRLNPGLMRDTASSIVHSRARVILQVASHITVGTLAGLESLIRGANKLPGRKLVFFLSGGFLLDYRNSDSKDRLQRIMSAAARNGVVIYSMDARGLVASLTDASSESNFDPSGRLARSTMGELTASQDGMHALARDTGGRAIFNTNDLKPGLAGALKETSFYYLLAWKPDRQAGTTRRFRRIEVSVPSRSELVVRVRRGFFDIEPEPPVTTKKPDTPPATNPAIDKQIQEALGAPYPDRRLPISLTLSYLQTPDEGARLSASMEVPAEFLTFAADKGTYQAVLTVLGAFFDDRGRHGQTFTGHINVNTPAEEAAKGYKRDLTYTYPIRVQPGIYQVRVAAKDERSGLVGSAQQWIEIPDLSKGKLSTSSLLLGERPETSLAAVSTNTPNPTDTVGLSISHRFRNNSYLRFLVFAYNAARSTTDGAPDVAIQIQLVRDNQPVLTTALKKIATEGVLDQARLPYAAEIPLTGLPLGYYRLQVTLIDRISKNSVVQQTRFEIY